MAGDKKKKKIWYAKQPQAGKGVMGDTPNTPRMARRGQKRQRARTVKARAR